MNSIVNFISQICKEKAESDSSDGRMYTKRSLMDMEWRAYWKYELKTLREKYGVRHRDYIRSLNYLMGFKKIYDVKKYESFVANNVDEETGQVTMMHKSTQIIE